MIPNIDLGLSFSSSSAARAGDIGGLTIYGGGDSKGLVATSGATSLWPWLLAGGLGLVLALFWRRQ